MNEGIITGEIEFEFKFPRINAESIRVKAATYGEAADKAIKIRTKNVVPLKADGEIYEEKPSLTKPVGAKPK
jgi:hypothetical protein